VAAEGTGLAPCPAVTTPRTTANAVATVPAATTAVTATTDAAEAPLGGPDRRWLWRVPLLLWLGWTGWRYLVDPDYWSIFSGIIFGSHEFGHLFFAPFGALLMVAGGSLMQLLVPIGAGALLVARRDWYGTAVAGCWLSFSLSNLAVYIGDAVAQELPLVSFSPDGGGHDWYYLLNRFNLLSYDLHIAMLTRRLAFAVLAAAFLWGLWIALRTVPRPVASSSDRV
jgi:hypothetical protein